VIAIVTCFIFFIVFHLSDMHSVRICLYGYRPFLHVSVAAVDDLFELYTKAPFIVFAVFMTLGMLALYLLSRVFLLVTELDRNADAPVASGPESEPVLVVDEDDGTRLAGSAAPLVSASSNPAHQTLSLQDPQTTRDSTRPYPIFTGTPCIERIFAYVRTMPLASRLWFLAVSYSTIGGALSSCNLLMTKSMCVSIASLRVCGCAL
jgi:hypothetical protein